MLFAYGFRVFFLAAAASAAAAGGLWALSLGGLARGAAVSVNEHAHEMVFGFGGAVVAGFVLTAVPNWTKTERVHGLPLGALGALWLAGRLAPWVPGPLATGLHTLGALFLVGVAVAIGAPVVRARSTRNYGVLLLVVALAGLAALSHAALAGLVAMQTTTLARHAAWALGLLVMVIGGRITPLFTQSALKKAGVDATVRARDRRDDVALAAAVLAVIANVIALPPVAVGGLFLFAAGAHAARLHGWGTFAAVRDPLLLVLHAGYLWLVLAFALAGLSALAPAVVAPPVALHALTVGAIGTFTLGMMARVALGHTGRPLRAPVLATIAFGVLNLAALVRLLGPRDVALILPAAATLWSVAFVLYLLGYTSILMRARADGAPG